MDPSLVAVHLYEVCRSFSRWYHECPILIPDEEALSSSRLALAEAVHLARNQTLVSAHHGNPPS